MASLSKTLLTTYPGKAIWTLFALALNAVRLPIWLIYYIPRSLRPHPEWSHKQAVRVRIVRAFLYNASIVEMKTTLSNLPGKEKDRFVVVNPAKQAYYVDAVSADPEVRPEKCGITWYPAAPSSAEKTGMVILHFHGGAYAIGDGRSDDAGFAAKTLLGNTEATHVACPQYRLASNPGCRFPAQLQDAVTCYAHLVSELGIDPRRIVLSGDSAGANLALALTRYITEHGEGTGLEKPAATLLWSCWANPESSVRLGQAVLDLQPNKRTDYVGGGFGLWGATKMLPSPTSGLTIESPYISFLKNPFKTDIPLYISVGECEVLYHDCLQLAEEFGAIQGNEVKLQIEEHAVHDVILVGKLVGFEKEAIQGVKRASVWLKDVTNSASAKL